MELELHSGYQEENEDKSAVSTDNESKSHSPSPEDRLLIKSKLARRVKVYYLQGEDWLDNGTGYCMGEVDVESKKPYFVVRNELDSGNVILKSFLEGTIQYQRQQETLIVWTDLTGKDLALSFQENEGCADLCEFIVKVQQENLSPMISLYYVLTTMQNSPDGPREITELIAGPITYPAENPLPENLGEILEIINQGSNSNYTRTKILEFILKQDYFGKLIQVFEVAEKSKDIQSLHLLSDIIKVILLYNEPDLLDDLIKTERNVIGLAGILEYDREFPKFKACHRDYLLDKSKFKTVVEIPELWTTADSDMSVFRKDFVLNYLKDVVLARNMDEQALGILSSIIYNNQLELISFMTDSNASNDFFNRLFLLYNENGTSKIQQKRDGVKMLHQYVLVAKNHQTSQTPEFFMALVKSGLFKMIEFALKDTQSETRVGGTELLVSIIEQDVSLINTATRGEYIDALDTDADGLIPDNAEQGDTDTVNTPPLLKLKLVSDMSTTVVLCQLLLEDKNPGLKIQAFEALKMLLSSSYEESPAGNFNEDKSSGDEYGPGVKQYFEAFYKEVAPMLFADFMELATEDAQKRRQITARIAEDPILYQHLCDLLSLLLREHDPILFKEFVCGSKMLKGIMRILELDAKVILKLGVVRCLKSILLLNDYAMNQFLIHHDLLHGFFVYFKTVAAANNLANSLCIDLLETIVRHAKGKNYRMLVMHAYYTEREFLLNSISYVSTGYELVHIAEAYIGGSKDATATSVDGDEDHFEGRNNLSLPIQTDKEDFSVDMQTGPIETGPTNIFQEIQKEFSGKRPHETATATATAIEQEPQEKCEPPAEETSPRKKKAALSFEQSPLETTASV